VTEWYWVGGDGRQDGPAETADLVSWIETGMLPPAAAVWREGLAGWGPASSMPELAEACASFEATRERGRAHFPPLALVSALAIPGAGQAYNGQPFKAVLFLLSSALVLPWLWSVFDAWRTSQRMADEGGRFGRGGFVWILLQGWLFLNVAAYVVVGLTCAGVLK
jgi:hypothetical protein